MPLIVYDEHIEQKWRTVVVPTLRKTGIAVPSNRSGERYSLQQYFDKQSLIWTVGIESPVEGGIYPIPQSRRPGQPCENRIFDVTSQLSGDPANAGGLGYQKVLHVHGLKAFAEAVSDAGPSPSRTVTAIMLSKLGATAMAIPVEGLNLALICDIWADITLPGFLVRNRPEQCIRKSSTEILLQQHPNSANSFVCWCEKATPEMRVGRYDEMCVAVRCPECKKHFIGGVMRHNACRRPCSYDSNTGQFYEHKLSKRLPTTPDRIALYDSLGRRGMSFEDEPDAPSIPSIITALGEYFQRRKNLQALREEWAPIQTCLEYQCAASGVTDCPPFHVENPRATASRMHGFTIYAFAICKPYPDWLKKGKEPFAKLTPLSVDPRSSADSLRGRDVPVFYGVRVQEKEFLIAFPQAIPLKNIEKELVIRPAPRPPSEERQIKYLSSWIDPANRGNSLLHAMVPPDPKEYLPYSGELSTPNLTDNQERAVRVGLGQAPLVLVKGPPGTGKTSVIVEIVRQSVAQGRRVLVSSQTHQAVGNVLERLDKIGSIPMIRYARDISKLTELERRYLQPHGASELDDCLAQSERNLQACKDAQLRLREEIRTVCARQRAIRKLHLLRERYIKQDDIRQKFHTRKINALKELCKKERQEQDKIYRPVHAGLERAHAQATATVRKHQDRITALRADLDNYEFQLKEIRESRGRLGVSSLLGKIGGHVKDIVTHIGKTHTPAFIVSADRLEKLRDECEKNLAEDEERLQAAQRQETSDDRRLRDCEAQYREEKRQILARHMAERIKWKTKYTRKHSQKMRIQIKEERRLLRITAGSVPLLKRWNPEISGAKVSLEDGRQAIPGLFSELFCTRKKIVLLQAWLRDLAARPEALPSFLRNQLRVFFSTCVGVAGWRELDSYGVTRFDLAIIDEAGHATIPETLIPLHMAKRALLIGDDQQLPPIVAADLSCRARDENRRNQAACAKADGPCWLETSLFSRLWTDKDLHLPRILLNIQFRMHEKIGAFISDTFYEGQLQNGREGEPFQFSSFTHPICLIDTRAYQSVRHEERLQGCTEEEDGTSFRNPLEQQIVATICRHLRGHVDNLPADADAVSVGVISPYSAQIQRLQSGLRDYFNSHEKLRFCESDVASVDRFQGAERDIIIVSFVRSPKECPRCGGKGWKNAGGQTTKRGCDDCNGTGYAGRSLRFVHDLKRMNVAFSRARKMLIMVGDIDALCNARGESRGQEALNAFHQYVRTEGQVLRVWETAHEE